MTVLLSSYCLLFLFLLLQATYDHLEYFRALHYFLQLLLTELLKSGQHILIYIHVLETFEELLGLHQVIWRLLIHLPAVYIHLFIGFVLHFFLILLIILVGALHGQCLEVLLQIVDSTDALGVLSEAI